MNEKENKTGHLQFFSVLRIPKIDTNEIMVEAPTWTHKNWDKITKMQRSDASS